MSRLLDGDNDRLDLSSSTFVDSTATETTPFTVAMWIKRARVSFGTEESLWYNGGAAQGNHLHACVINPDNTLTIRARTTANSSKTSTGTLADTTTWHFVVAKVISTTSLGISIDGAAFEVATGLTARDPTIATDLFRIGGTLAATPLNDLNARIAWVGVWRSALSDTHVSTLWNGGAGRNLNAVQSPVAVWDLTENQSPELNNISPGTFDLTVTGPTFSTDNPFTIGTSINATKQSLTLTPNVAVVQKNKNVNATKQSIIVTPRIATDRLSRNIVAASPQLLSQIERLATVTVGSGIHATTQALNQIERAATAKLSRNIAAARQSMLLNAFTSPVQIGTSDLRLLTYQAAEDTLVRM